MRKEEALQFIKSLISEWKSDLYNIPDILISTLYLELIAERNRDSLKLRLHQILKNLKAILSFASKEKSFSLPPCSVVFWPAEYSHLRQLYPVARKLANQGVPYLWLVNKTKVRDQLIEYKESFIFFEACNFGSAEVFKDYSDTVDQLGSTHPLFSGRLRNLLKRNLRQIISLIQFNEAIIEACHPRVLVAGNDLTLEGRLASYVFKRNGIFTCCVQHGDMSGALESVHVVDEFYVYGNESLARTKTFDSATQFKITGAPYLDSLRSLQLGLDPAIQKMLTIDASKTYILIAFSGAGNNTSSTHHQQLVNAVFKLSQVAPEINIVIKLHPKDRPELYEGARKQFRVNNVYIVKHNDSIFGPSIFQWLQGCKLLITGASTTAIEAMRISIPVVTLDFLHEYHSIPFISAGTTIHVTEPDALITEVRRIIYDSGGHHPNQRAIEFAENYFQEGGDASGKIVAEILSHLKNG